MGKKTKRSTKSSVLPVEPSSDSERLKQSNQNEREQLNISQYRMSTHWRMLNGLALISVWFVYEIWLQVEENYASYQYFDAISEFEDGKEGEPVYFSATPQWSNLSEQDVQWQTLFKIPIMYANIELTHEKEEKIEVNSRTTTTITDASHTIDLSAQSYFVHQGQTFWLQPKKGTYIFRDDDSPKYIGLEEVSQDYDLAMVKPFFGEDSRLSTDMSMVVFKQQESLIYGRVEHLQDGKRILVSTTEQPVIISTVPHNDLVLQYGLTFMLCCVGIVAFLGSKFHVWRGRHRQTYLSDKARYWVFTHEDGGSFTGFWVLCGFTLVFLAVFVYWDFMNPIHQTQFYAVSFIIYSVLLNWLKSLESFFVADRQQNELLQVDVMWGHKRLIPVAKLSDLELSTRVSKPSRTSSETYSYIVGTAVLMDTPEARAIYSNGAFHADMSEGMFDGVHDIRAAFEQWKQ